VAVPTLIPVVQPWVMLLVAIVLVGLAPPELVTCTPVLKARTRFAERTVLVCGEPLDPVSRMPCPSVVPRPITVFPVIVPSSPEAIFMPIGAMEAADMSTWLFAIT
jgi:hypothetical protein